MEELLANVGIDNLDSFIYEYEPVELDWWDSKNKTTVEIETHQDAEGVSEFSVVFCPEVEGIVERTIVYVASFKSDALQNQALIEKKVCNKLSIAGNFKFSKEQNAYIIESYEEASKAFNEISNLIINKNPIYKIDLKETVEEDEDIVPYKLGDTLDHFVAMMDMNSMDFTESNIIESIEISIQFEGDEYFSQLKNDVNNEFPHNFKEEYDMDDETLEFVKNVIRNYTRHDD